MADQGKPQPVGRAGPDAVEEAVGIIAAEFAVAMGSPERVTAAGQALRGCLAGPQADAAEQRLAELAGLLDRRGGLLAERLFLFLEEAAAGLAHPWPLLEKLLRVRDRRLQARAVDHIVRLAEAGSLPLDDRVWPVLARWVEAEECRQSDQDVLGKIGRLIRRGSGSEVGGDAVVQWYVGAGEWAGRRLAARVLDSESPTAAPEPAARLLGIEAHAFLTRYLAYTRATHLDVLEIAAPRDGRAAMVESLRAAEKVCGERLLREVLSELGWPRVNFGLHVERFIGLSLGGSFPVLFRPAEAALLADCEDAVPVFDRLLIVAHGGSGREEPDAAAGDGAIDRFRRYNLVHAEVLAEIADVAPLTATKVRRIIDRLDRIVAEFAVLFSAHDPECAALPARYTELRARVLAELANGPPDGPLSAEAARLVQMFEDPADLAGVHTLHGLKRYLHQRGLRLAFRLFESNRATNRTVDLIVANAERILCRTSPIRFIDFEPAPAPPGAPGRPLPYAVQVMVDGFGRQMLHGQQNVPNVDVFCYGNEVHYYLRYRNHPAFLRMDFAPPLSGGMIDLEYYGVSKHELDQHPDLELHAIGRFLRRLEFDVQIANTRIHARYDKERTTDLSDLCAKALAVCALTPYLMEVDWVIGGLQLGDAAKEGVAGAWAEFFARWRTLPLAQILSKDRQHILLAAEADPHTGRERVWDGQGSYRDRFTAPWASGVIAALRRSLADRGLDAVVAAGAEGEAVTGQVEVERAFLLPLREAVACGEAVEAEDGLRAAPPAFFRREHEAERFARLLVGPESGLAGAVRTAGVAAALERSLRFQTTGSVQGYDVQHARIALRGGAIELYVLRDAGGMVRLAVAATGGCLHYRRSWHDRPWADSASCNASDLAALLRSHNYLMTDDSPRLLDDDGWRLSALRALFAEPNPSPSAAPVGGERVLRGIPAAPGRAVGPVVFGTAGREPAELDGAVLVAATIHPEDTSYLRWAAGVISTGGGALSHAGLLAVQLGKPSLIISGEWRRDERGAVGLLCRYAEYVEERKSVGPYEVVLRRSIRERFHCIAEGDLVAVDARTASVHLLGQDPAGLALHDGLRRLADAAWRLPRADDARETLVHRGRRLQAGHQLTRLFGRLDSPVLARHAVRELLLGGPAMVSAGDERSRLLEVLLANAAVSGPARDAVNEVWGELVRRQQADIQAALHAIPTSDDPYEILSLRLSVLRQHEMLLGAQNGLAGGAARRALREAETTEAVELAALRRLRDLRVTLVDQLSTAAEGEASIERFRHPLKRLDRLDRVLGGSRDESSLPAGLGRQLDDHDAVRRRTFAGRRVVFSGDGGLELHRFIGGKAANLAETSRLVEGVSIPAWFVVADCALREVLASLVEVGETDPELGEFHGSVLRSALEQVLGRADRTDEQKAAAIGRLWQSVRLPGALTENVLRAYRKLATEDPAAPATVRPVVGQEASAGGGRDRDETQTEPKPDEPYVAVRSSALEEDAEAGWRPGEFDTFLFVRGEGNLLDYLRRAWSGLWTERAIRGRRLAGFGPLDTGGGVIVQRIVWSRVSGVLQTVNLAEGRLGEMVINAGLGLGAGVVSGAVAADQITVSKEKVGEQQPLRFRYITADKREQVLFDERRGVGTNKVATLYHQRLRPALEYMELSELVRVARRLEAAYGYPLDIEFGIAGTGLHLLQVRPVADFGVVYGETCRRFPIRGADGQAKEQAS